MQILAKNELITKKNAYFCPIVSYINEHDEMNIYNINN